MLLPFALAVASLGPGAPLALGQEAGADAGEAPESSDSVRARTSRDRVTYLRDPRLEADSTLFPYEWPALERLRAELARLRPALEAGSVPELARALPDVGARADTLIAGEAIPELLAARRSEVAERLTALAAALDRVGELAPAALAAPPDTSLREPAGFAPLDESSDSNASGGTLPGEPGRAPTSEPPSAPPGVITPPAAEEGAAGNRAPAVAGASDSAAAGLAGAAGEPGGPAADSLAALDPVAAFLEAWRDVYAQEEALLHRMRDPFGE